MRTGVVLWGALFVSGWLAIGCQGKVTDGPDRPDGVDADDGMVADDFTGQDGGEEVVSGDSDEGQVSDRDANEEAPDDGETPLFFTVSGSVSGAITKGVKIYFTGGTSVLMDETDDNGNFLFEGIASGHYRVIASAQGYSLQPPYLPVEVRTENVTGRPRLWSRERSHSEGECLTNPAPSRCPALP